MTNGKDEELPDLEPVEELSEAVDEALHAIDAEHASWQQAYLTRYIPSIFLDRSLKILDVNESFRRVFGDGGGETGRYFTQFYAPSFDDTKSADLFRSILSPDTGYSWQGKIEKNGSDQLLRVFKVWIVPLGDVSKTPPRAFGVACFDMTVEHRQVLQSTFASLLGAARLKDNDTGNHIERVNLYARALAEKLHGRPETPAVDREFVESIGLVSALHDIGKIGTPDDILNKAGRLEAWEWDVMKQHTTNGAYILSTYPNPMAREIALRHHERWDGSGYPHGFSGELIPLSARIVALGDVYDALRMRRNYKEAYTHEQTVANMVAERGTHFDPFLVDVFIGMADEFRQIFDSMADQQ